jgi:hypothetical protein
MGFFGFLDDLIGSLFGTREIGTSTSSSVPEGKLEGDIIREVAKEYELSPEDLKVDVRYEDLPIIHYFQRVGDRLYHYAGKILGYFNPEDSSTIGIDYELKRRSRWDRDHLREYAKTFAEEVAHKAQYLKGKLVDRYKDFGDYLSNYDEDPNEKEAKVYSDRVVERVLGRGQNYLALYN